jgi:hypothetical protein
VKIAMLKKVEINPLLWKALFSGIIERVEVYFRRFFSS